MRPSSMGKNCLDSNLDSFLADVNSSIVHVYSASSSSIVALMTSLMLYPAVSAANQNNWDDWILVVQWTPQETAFQGFICNLDELKTNENCHSPKIWSKLSSIWCVGHQSLPRSDIFLCIYMDGFNGFSLSIVLSK